jgi:hypothetical protein
VDGVKTTITDTPTVNEVESILKNIEVAFRGFKLDKADASEDEWWPNEQLTFNTETIVHLVNPSPGEPVPDGAERGEHPGRDRGRHEDEHLPRPRRTAGQQLPG